MSLLRAWNGASRYTHIYLYWSSQEFLIERNFQLDLEATCKLFYPSPEILPTELLQKDQFSATDALVGGILQTKLFTFWTSPFVLLNRKHIYAHNTFLFSLHWFPSSCGYVNADVFIILLFITVQFHDYEHKTRTNIGKFFTACIKSVRDIIE